MELNLVESLASLATREEDVEGLSLSVLDVISLQPYNRAGRVHARSVRVEDFRDKTCAETMNGCLLLGKLGGESNDDEPETPALALGVVDSNFISSDAGLTS